MWEYVKGSEADFEGAPEWATLVTGDNPTWFVEMHEGNARYCDTNGGDVYTIPNDWGIWPEVIAERRKVDDLQQPIKPDSPADRFLQQAFDTVQRPAHYNQSGIECIDAIAASMSAEEFQAYLKGNVQKYLWRYQHKNGVEDVRKAHWYLERLVKELRK